MLQTFRNNLKGAGATIIVLFISIPFVFFGIDALFINNSSSQEVAKAGDEVITELELRQAISIYRNQLLSRFSEIDLDQLDEQRVRETVLDGLILDKAVQQAARNGSMAVPEEFVYSLLVDVPAYQSDGQFNVERYEYAIRQMGYTPTSHARAISGEVLERVFIQGILSSVIVTEHQLENLASMVAQKRDYYYLTIPQLTVSEKITISEQEIKDFYDNNQTLFLSPEEVKVEYVELQIDDLTAEVDVPEADIQALYEIQKADLEATSQKEVAHILLDPESEGYQSKLDSLLHKLNTGGNFAELAREFSEDPGSSESGGQLGFVAPGDLPESLEQVLESMEVGEISEPISSEAGTHILLLKSDQKGTQVTYDDMLPVLREQLAREAAAELYIERIETMRETAYNADSLAETADMLSLPLKQSDYFGRQGGEEIIASNPEIVRVAFSEDVLLNGYPSEVLELSDDHALVLRVIEHRPESVQPLSQVKDQVNDILLRQKQYQGLRELAADIGEQVEQGASLEEIAKEENYDWQVGIAVKRNDVRVDQEVRDFVFGMPANTSKQQVDGFQKANGDYVVLTLTSVEAGGSDSLTKQQLQALSEQLSQSSAISELENYRQYLLSQIKVVR